MTRSAPRPARPVTALKYPDPRGRRFATRDGFAASERLVGFTTTFAMTRAALAWCRATLRAFWRDQRAEGGWRVDRP